MTACLAEDDLLDLVQGRRRLGDAPVLEAHLADCAACSGLLSTLIAATPEDRCDLVGTSLGPYRLDGLIGAGAMGEVYRAWDTRLMREVAVKVLPRRLAESPDRIRRLEAEARAAAAIAHGNVVTIYDTGTDQGVPYIVSELIQGETLRSVIDRGPIARATALELTLQLARGLAAAHAHGVVHRDLKPANLIVRDGTLKILDFGLAKLTSDRDVEATEPGALVGTSGYLAPEQARGEPADARSDIFAVGAIGYELLTGRRAFAGATFAERLSAVLRDTPEPIEDPAWPILLRCLDKNPAKRFQSASDLAWALDKLDAAPVQRAPRSRPTVSRRTFVIGAAATGLGGILVGRALAPRPSPFRPAFAQLTFRQGRVGRARFTPDGGSILYSAAWDGEPMTMFTIRLAGGGTRALALPPAQLLAVSSRGQLALSLDHRYYESFHQEGQLALAPLEGGEPRALGIAVQDADFAPDGDTLALVRRAGNRFRLECPLDRVLLEAGWISHPRVSPDGSSIACFVHAGPHDNAGNLVIVPRTGGAARTVSAGWSSIDGVAWSRNGRTLWVSAAREGGNNSVRALALDGKELVHHPSAGRLRIHDRSASGTLAITHVSGRLHMLAKAPGAATETELGLSDVTLVGAMTADGSALAFSEFGDVNTANGAYIRPTSGAAAVLLGNAVPWDVAHGRGVLCTTYAGQLAVYPMQAGPSRAIETGLARVRWARWCAGDALVAVGSLGDRPARVWRFDGTLTPLTPERSFGLGAVSPDGRTLALIADDLLLAIDIGSAQQQRQVMGRYRDELVCGWSADGQGVLVRSQTLPIQIRRVELATGTSSSVLTITPPPVGLRGVSAVVTSLDAGAYAYSYGQELSRLYTMTTEDAQHA